MNNEGKIKELEDMLEQMTNLDPLKRLENLFKEVIPDDEVIFLANTDYKDLHVAAPLEVSIFNPKSDEMAYIMGTRFRMEDGQLFCVEEYDRDYGEYDECFWNVDFNFANLWLLNEIFWQWKIGNSVPKSEAGSIEWITRDEADEIMESREKN